MNEVENIISLIPSSLGESLNWLGVVIQWLVGIGPIVGVGIILFTIILKTVVLPLDAFSKIKMRKNNLKMEKMRPQLEKLQKQYANDKQAYNAKMMELYKKNGYSMLGPCLPMIVTLVIFIFVMQAFSIYSNYTNLHTYEQMAEAYNSAILTYAAEEPDYKDVPRTGHWKPFSGSEEEGEKEEEEVSFNELQYYKLDMTYGKEDDSCLITVTVHYVYYFADEEEKNNLFSMTPEERDEFLNAKFDIDGAIEKSGVHTEYEVKTERVLAIIEEENGDEYDAIRDAAKKLENEIYREDDLKGTVEQQRAHEIMQQVGRDAASNTYYDVKDSFLWVGNIWLSDVSYAHPVTMPEKVTGDFDIDDFNELTYNLSAEKAAPNGYFILIILSIGFMFLSQFILSRSQKAQNELQTADGRGKKTQKIMMIVMPVIYGIFAFFYSAAFTIYMITSSVYNVVSTLIINAIIDRRFRKREEQEIQDKYNKRLPQHAASGAVSKASAGTNNRQSVNKQLRQNKLRISEKEKKSADTNREKRNGGK